MIWVWARHGNTFGPTDTVVYAGKRNDLPLAAHGIEQAHRLADAWLAFGVRPEAIYCGALLRLRQTAEIVCRRLGWSQAQLRIDARLDELDYGAWTGQTRGDVVQRFGAQSVSAWENESIWPQNAGWTSSAAEVQHELAQFMRETHAAHKQGGPILAISSNGRLRYALLEVPGAFEAHLRARRLKVRTGHVGILCRHASGRVEAMTWNTLPAVALGQLAYAMPHCLRT